MCRNHRLIYSCHHFHERITLCATSITPLIRRATVFPYTATLQEVRASSGHDVILTAELCHVPCVDCQLPDLDVWDLEGAVRYMDAQEAKLNASPLYRISVEIDEAVSSMPWTPARGPIAPKRSRVTGMTPLPSSPVGISRDPKPELVSTFTMLEDVDSIARHPKQKRFKPCKLQVTSTYLPYTGGLGLLVTAHSPSKPAARSDESSLTLGRDVQACRDRKVMAKL